MESYLVYRVMPKFNSPQFSQLESLPGLPGTWRSIQNNIVFVQKELVYAVFLIVDWKLFILFL